MQTWQDKDKANNSDTDTEVVKPVQKAAIKSTAMMQVPAWSNASESALPSGLQAKLTINQPGDVYEQEADRVAEQVMRMADGGSPGARKDMSLMRKANIGEHATHEAPPIVNQALSSNGQPLEAGTQEAMGARFGQDFDHVRVHADGHAAESAQAIHAWAYTVGSDVVFGEGQYQPGTSEGQRLLAHELTHVVQQGAGQFIIQRAVALVDDDYKALAQQLHKALGGLGTKALPARLVTWMMGYKESIYVSLQKLEKDPVAISKLSQVYKDEYKTDLEVEIRSQMEGEALRLVLELLGIRDDPTKGWMITSKPSTDEEYKAAARQLNVAIGKLHTETVYAILFPFKRDTIALDKLKNTYQRELSGGLTGRGLEEDIKDKLFGDLLAYALYLLDAPLPAPQKAGPTITDTGTKATAAKVGGGDVSVNTGVKFTTHRGESATEGFSIGYKGGLASESRWLQFIWREIIISLPVKGENRLSGPVPVAGYSFTTDPDKPNYNVDSKDPGGPFYEGSYSASRTAEATTMYDEPTPIVGRIRAAFADGATKVISRAHFNTYLIRDYKTIYHIYLQVEWVFTSSHIPPRVQTVRTAEEADSLPEDMKTRLAAQYPKYAYIR